MADFDAQAKLSSPSVGWNRHLMGKCLQKGLNQNFVLQG